MLICMHLVSSKKYKIIIVLHMLQVILQICLRYKMILKVPKETMS